jgi:pyrroline-5-carboxylate reductase
MNIGILGGGTMGEIIARALLQREVVAPEQILVADLVPERREELAALGVRVTAQSEKLLGQTECLLICVKPQNARKVLLPLRGMVPAETLVISIMAGIDLAFMAEMLDHEVVVRSMPNLPARIGQGVTVWMPAQAVPDRERLLARIIFQSMGSEVEVADEGLLDAATAVSGTGPAYIFYIAENLLDAARGFGFSEAQALKLVRQTFRGAMDLWAETGEAPDELRRKVTSKGGTTHAAVTTFQERDIGGIFRAGVTRARDRARELAHGAKENGH